MTSKLLTVVAVFAIAFAAVNLLITMDKVGKLTGYAVNDSGTANLTIIEDININFTVDLINWSSGGVLSPNDWAYLNSEGVMLNNFSFENVTDGLRLQSDSNVNISVNLSSSLDALNFLDGGIVRAIPSSFQWKMNDYEAGTCPTLTPTSYTGVSTAGIEVCQNFGYDTPQDTIEIDLAVNISRQAPTGVKGVVITATGWCGSYAGVC